MKVRVFTLLVLGDVQERGWGGAVSVTCSISLGSEGEGLVSQGPLAHLLKVASSRHYSSGDGDPSTAVSDRPLGLEGRGGPSPPWG